MITKFRNHLTAIAIAVTAATTATSIVAQDVRIGAMREGTAWYVFAATLEQMIEPKLGANSVEIIARGGGVANPMVVQGGKADIALSMPSARPSLRSAGANRRTAASPSDPSARFVFLKCALVSPDAERNVR